MGVYGAPLMRRTERLVGRIRVPIRWVADVANMSSNRELATLCATDPRGGGVRVPLGFLSSYFSFEHTAPEAFRTTPVLLTHPADDRWTPPELSLQFLRRINAPTEFVMLDGCGHFPVEEPGLTQFHDAVATLLHSVAERHRTKPSSPA
jgi:alpha-beta hydrolase superfamily lysophospholipase